MELTLFLVFCLVYLGMILGTWPGLAIDRTGIALLGAIAFIEIRKLSLEGALSDIDIPSITILFSFMIISAQLYFSGFYTYISKSVENWDVKPDILLLVIILISGLLSAVLINDIVCLAMTPLLVRITLNKGLNPIPYLLGLAIGSNIGSALTLIGNPQNMLIGQVLQVPFGQYILDASVPCVTGWLVAWGIISLQTKGQWKAKTKNKENSFKSVPFNPWQTLKGLVLIVLLLGLFLFFNIPREHLALVAAGILLLSRTMASKMMLSFIDWQLLVLFMGLFIVNREFNQTDMMKDFVKWLESSGINLASPAWLFSISTVLSNLISNVPAVMLLLPFAKSPAAGSVLALSSTLAGNMFIIGSIANIIVVTQASNFGVQISWKKHLVAGLPITLITLVISAIWLSIRY